MLTAARRILAILIVIALAWTLQPARAADVKLTLWRLKTYIPPADKILDTTVQDCAKQIGVDVQIQTYTFDDMWTKELGELAPNAEGAVRFGGKFYAVPHYMIPLILFYRKDILEKIGAQPPDTWEAINDISVKIKKAGIQDFPQGFPWNRTGDGYDPAMSLLWSYGAAWVDKSGKYIGLPKDKAVQAIKVVTPAFLTDKTSAFDFLSWSGSGNNEAFMAGKIAFTPNGPSILFQEDSTKHPLR